MFEVPDAKRVRREDLGASDSSDWSDGGDESADAELRAKLNAQIARSLGWSMGIDESNKRIATPSQPKAADEETLVVEPGNELGEDAEDEAYEFRLFSTSAQVRKIVLEDDELKGDGAFVLPRPLSYYLTADIPQSEKENYAHAALSGEDILARSQHKAPGLAQPWKVTSITTMGKKTKIPDGNGNDEDAAKRKKPGKKKRIAQRTKERAEKAKAEEEAQKLVVKEEHVKDKKKRLNRLKKLRKRAKEKEKKLAARGEGGDGGIASDSEDDS